MTSAYVDNRAAQKWQEKQAKRLKDDGEGKNRNFDKSMDDNAGEVEPHGHTGGKGGGKLGDKAVAGAALATTAYLEIRNYEYSNEGKEEGKEEGKSEEGKTENKTEKGSNNKPKVGEKKADTKDENTEFYHMMNQQNACQAGTTANH